MLMMGCRKSNIGFTCPDEGCDSLKTGGALCTQQRSTGVCYERSVRGCGGSNFKERRCTPAPFDLERPNLVFVRTFSTNRRCNHQIVVDFDIL